jgi:hypothetical protein
MFTLLTNLTATPAQIDESAAGGRHAIRGSQRAGYHTESSPGHFRFIGIFDKELHLHHDNEIVIIPLADLWKLAETHGGEKFNDKAPRQGRPRMGSPSPLARPTFAATMAALGAEPVE